jgi:hypothetical protein
MFANTRPLARAVSIGVLGIALLSPDAVRAEPGSRVLNLPYVRRVPSATHRTAAGKTFPFHGNDDAVRQASTRRRDALLNGVVIGTAVGAGIGLAVTHAVRDSDLVFAQYARGALVFAALGAGAGLGIDALLSRVSPVPNLAPRPVSIAPLVWRDGAGVAVGWRW